LVAFADLNVNCVFAVPASFKHCMPPPSRQQQHQHANHPMFYRIRDHHHLLGIMALVL
jgi:hypothetical protein